MSSISRLFCSQNSGVAAMKSQAVAKMARQHNAVAAERIVREELQSSKRAASHDIEAAERLAALEATSEALAELRHTKIQHC